MALAHHQEKSVLKARLEARITADQKKLFQHAADLMGQTLTDFVISTLQETAAKIIREHEIIHLGNKDRKLLVKMLLNPPAPNKHLKKAAKRYQREVKHG